MKIFYKLYDTCCSIKLQNYVKSDIDDMTNTSKISDMSQKSLMIPACLDGCTYQVSSPYIKCLALPTIGLFDLRKTVKVLKVVMI